jgi:hypothetical protein
MQAKIVNFAVFVAKQIPPFKGVQMGNNGQPCR